MKHIRWKILVITCAVCLLPVLLGLYMWNELPEHVAIHFNINNEPDNFASKGFAVFVMPLFMIATQMICCIATDIQAHKHGEQKKFVFVAKWIIPVMTLIIQPVTLFYSAGWNIDIRRVAVLAVGVIFVALGNYIPKLDYIKNYRIDTESARKINRFCGFGMVIMGFFAIISLFFAPIVSVIWLLVLIPYVLISIIYSIVVTKRK